MRNSTKDIVTTVEPTRVVSFACPPPAVGVSGLLSVNGMSIANGLRGVNGLSGVNGLRSVNDLLSVSTVAVVDVPQRTSARLRPSSRQWAALGRITAEGAGYVGSDLVAGVIAGTERRPAAAPAAAAQRTTSTARTARFTQNKQLHLMSRRDPCSWRPPV